MSAGVKLQGHEGLGEPLRRAGAHLGEEKRDGGTRPIGMLTGHENIILISKRKMLMRN